MKLNDIKVPGARVLVKPIKQDKTKGGIFIPGKGSYEDYQTGIVVKVGRGGILSDGSILPNEVQVGQKIIYAPDREIKISIEEEDYVILWTEHNILLVIEDALIKEAGNA